MHAFEFCSLLISTDQLLSHNEEVPLIVTICAPTGTLNDLMMVRADKHVYSRVSHKVRHACLGNCLVCLIVLNLWQG